MCTANSLAAFSIPGTTLVVYHINFANNDLYVFILSGSSKSLLLRVVPDLREFSEPLSHSQYIYRRPLQDYSRLCSWLFFAYVTFASQTHL